MDGEKSFDPLVRRRKDDRVHIVVTEFAGFRVTCGAFSCLQRASFGWTGNAVPCRLWCKAARSRVVLLCLCRCRMPRRLQPCAGNEGCSLLWSLLRPRAFAVDRMEAAKPLRRSHALDAHTRLPLGVTPIAYLTSSCSFASWTSAFRGLARSVSPLSCRCGAAATLFQRLHTNSAHRSSSRRPCSIMPSFSFHL